MFEIVRENLELTLIIVASVFAGGGWLARRWLTNEGARERATELSTITQTIAQMKASAVTMEEIEEFRRFISRGRPPRPPIQNVSENEAQVAAESWAETEPQTQSEMNQAAAEELRERDEKLNGIIDRLATLTTAEEFRELKTTQEKWLLFRDAHAQFVARLFEGGSMRPLWYITTVLSATEDRIDELSAYLEVREEGR